MTSQKPNKILVKNALQIWYSIDARTAMNEQAVLIGWLELLFIALEQMFVTAINLEHVSVILATRSVFIGQRARM